MTGFRATFPTAAAAAAVAFAVATFATTSKARQDCCFEGNGRTATKWLNDEAKKANGYLNGWGLLARVPDFECVLLLLLGWGE